MFPIHFLFTLNIEKSSLWQVEYIPERFYSQIKNDSTNSIYSATVGGDGQRIFTYTQKIYSDTVSPKPNMMQLWQKTLFDSNLNINVPNHPAQYFDYLVTKPKYVKDILPLYDSIDYSEFTKFRLYKRKNTPKRKMLREFITQPKSESSDEFIEFYHETFDSCNYDALLLGIQLRLQSLSHPFRARVVAELKYLDGKQIDYQFFQLNWMYDRMEKDNKIVQSMIFNNLKHHLINGPLEVKIYLWNIRKKPYTLYEAKVEEFGVFD